MNGGLSGKLSTFIIGKEWCVGGWLMSGLMVLPMGPATGCVCEGGGEERKYYLVVRTSLNPQFTTLAV